MAGRISLWPALAAHLGVLSVVIVFLADASMQEEYVLFLLVLMCLLLF